MDAALSAGTRCPRKKAFIEDADQAAGAIRFAAADYELIRVESLRDLRYVPAE
jgi:hypothetical protein